MNKLTVCITGFVVAVCAPSIAFAQFTDTELKEFLDGLEKPLVTVVLRFEDSGRNEVWHVDSQDEDMPSEEWIQDAAVRSSSISEEPGLIVAIDRNGNTHQFPELVDGLLLGEPSGVSPLSWLRECANEASEWTRELRAERRNPVENRRAATSRDFVVAFGVNGGVCRKTEGRITQGDLIHVGVYGPANVVNELRLDIPSCSLESTVISIASSMEGLELHADEEDVQVQELRRFPSVECFDDSITVQIRRPDNSLAFSETLQQYRRFRGTFQIGAVWTELDEPTFMVSDLGSGPVIRSDIDGSRGPRFMGSLVVYGLPHYFQSFGNRSARYSGRDIVNENTFADRLGLALSFGLSDTKDTLGIGLSLEIVTGVNLTVTQLYRRVSVLDGVAVGDPFSGSAGDIPTQRSWEDEVTFGLSIDGRYLVNFFGSGRN